MDYWNHWGWLMLMGLAFFPRITLLFGSFVASGPLWWIGWFLAPHVTVAVLSIPFWDSNPVLVVLAGLMALAGTGGESGATVTRRR